jgi:hypothetical protein
MAQRWLAHMSNRLKSLLSTLRKLGTSSWSLQVLRGPLLRRAVTIFVLIFVAANLAALSQLRSGTFTPLLLFNGQTAHPIAQAIGDAREAFDKRSKAQSTDLISARIEYSRRYGFAPPSGFDVWFRLAQQNDFVMIDEFDTVMRKISPFRNVRKSYLQHLSQKAAHQISAQILKYEVRGGSISMLGGTGASWFKDSLRRLLPEEWARCLPNMTLAINTYDEPKVVIPSHGRDLANGGYQYGDGAENDDSDHPIYSGPTFRNLGHQDVWNAIGTACASLDAARQPECDEALKPQPLEFVTDLRYSRDVCTHCDLHQGSGFLLSPYTFSMTQDPIPILSQSAPSLFGDIMFPSPFYADRFATETPDNTTWASKDSILYWTGSATGGYAKSHNWRQFQRQRLALLMSPTSNASITLLNQTIFGAWTPYSTTISALTPHISVRIIGTAAECSPQVCAEEKQIFGISPHENKDPENEVHRHKFLLDVDGNSFSGRFHRLLRTNSVVLKQTVFEEWHDDRLWPWVHYVPVNTDFVELPELVRFLATTGEGEGLAERITRETRAWAERSLRVVDMQLVWFRILLELGKLLGEDADGV